MRILQLTVKQNTLFFLFILQSEKFESISAVAFQVILITLFRMSLSNVLSKLVELVSCGPLPALKFSELPPILLEIQF